MAALSTTGANIARQKAYNTVYGTGTVVTGASPSPNTPYNFYAIKALFLHLACNKGNPDLQFVPFGDADITAATGYSPITGAHTLYAVYAKSRTAPATGSAFLVNDANAPTGHTGVTTIKVMTQFSTGNQSFVWVNGNGIAMANTLSIASVTKAQTGTASATGDGGDGFCIIGA